MTGLRLLLIAAPVAIVGAIAMATAASAETYEPAVWLVGGVSIATSLLAVQSGEFLFEDTSTKADLICSAIFDMEVKPGGETTINHVLDLSGKEIGELSGEGLLCKPGSVCESGNIQLWPMSLSWLKDLLQGVGTGVIVWTVTKFLSRLPIFAVTCLVLGISVSDECQQEEGNKVRLINVAGGVEVSEEAGEPLGNCTLGGSKTGVMTVLKGNLITTSEGTLSASK